MINLLPIFSSISVYLALLVEGFFPYPHIVEEFIKFFFIWLLINLKPEGSFVTAVLIGFMFGITETFLYAHTSFQIGGFSILIKRAIYTIPLHTLTAIVIYYFAKIGKNLIYIGLSMAILIHYVYNLLAFYN